MTMKRTLADFLDPAPTDPAAQPAPFNPLDAVATARLAADAPCVDRTSHAVSYCSAQHQKHDWAAFHKA
ncbi:hypothetical protein HDU98_009735, partial [Podochytrium sp. JEL0797]